MCAGMAANVVRAIGTLQGIYCGMPNLYCYPTIATQRLSGGRQDNGIPYYAAHPLTRRRPAMNYPIITPILGDEITVRPLQSRADYAACVQLQRETWGDGYTDCVPISLLKVSQLIGGIVGGAFSEDGALLGFVYGLTGVWNQRPVHWSHMLAVRPEFRDRGIGRRLKEYQHSMVRELGIGIICWTFDPLVARNAHLNINRLGTQVCEYIPDMYGDTGSQLHAFGTDRFLVSWAVDGTKYASPGPVPMAWQTAPLAGSRDPHSLVVRVEIPADVEALPVNEARDWRQATRADFTELLAHDYDVAGFLSGADQRCYYVLARAARPDRAAPIKLKEIELR
jgi:chorismate synthase